MVGTTALGPLDTCSTLVSGPASASSRVPAHRHQCDPRCARAHIVSSPANTSQNFAQPSTKSRATVTVRCTPESETEERRGACKHLFVGWGEVRCEEDCEPGILAQLTAASPLQHRAQAGGQCHLALEQRDELVARKLMAKMF